MEELSGTIDPHKHGPIITLNDGRQWQLLFDIDDFDTDFNRYAYLTDYAVGIDKGGVSPIVANYMMQMEDFGGVG